MSSLEYVYMDSSEFTCLLKSMFTWIFMRVYMDFCMSLHVYIGVCLHGFSCEFTCLLKCMFTCEFTCVIVYIGVYLHGFSC